MPRIPHLIGSLLFALATLAGCSSSVEVNLDKGMREADLEEDIIQELTEMAGTAPDDVDCPGDLAAEVGKVMRCTLTAGPDELGLTVTVTEIEGSQMAYDIEVDEM